MDHAIELSNVSYRASPTFEIRNLDLTVPYGSIYGFLGPNGSGKTTTIRLAMGHLRADAGRIEVLGTEIPRESPRALLRTGYVPERPHLYRQLTIREALWLHSGYYRTWDVSRAEELLAGFNLREDQRISSLSKGQVGQFLFVLVISQRPELLILDEPTDGLDPIVRKQVLSALLGYVADTGATVFISSHLVHELERICDWVGVLDKGSLVAELPMESFKAGIKRLRVTNAPASADDAPFIVLLRENTDPVSGVETWLVRGWKNAMTQYFDGVGASVREVVHLDLEEAFVELLASARETPSGI